ncbi:unnamed protein product [Rotaria sordida]|uniref:Uncharacterized protein n=1 Tax=Rotaria sordida TaxID=392033 RepID=A0A818RX16_9BILA|nr:unnamed protein product [Rotaria sordida]CAF1212371.1 unnamed protein product [Rotaria sordida]CAF1314269.1 unnamed protein product [Rotaria sordida]CAF1355554.1 unnamed protein product [Rotaria sordida]CAF3660656.1 unnamed protein product [Rotaria sordida]
MANFFEFSGDPNFERIGRRVSVPDNDIARCMYYLSCVFTAIEYDDDDMDRYSDYKNYWSLSENEQRYVFLLCIALSPDEFEDKVFFENDALTGPGSGNEFYEISQVRFQLMAVNAIVIAGQRRQVKRIMTYKRSWMQANYYGPMQRLTYQYNLQRRRQAVEEALRQQIQSGACIIS